MGVTQPTLFELPAPSAKRSDVQTATQKKQRNVTIVKSLSEALKCTVGGLCMIYEDWPSFDPNNRAYFTPGSDKYIEAERLPKEWVALVGKTVCADRTTVGTIADLLEELPPDVANEWRELYASSESDEGEMALDAFEEKHRIRWYGEGYYIDNGDGDEESEEQA